MNLDSNFIKALKIPFSDVLPPGAYSKIREKLSLSHHAPARALRGEWWNEDVVEAGLQIVEEQIILLTKFRQQFTAPQKSKPAPPHPTDTN